jgi:predicted small integral membrane protein
MKTAVRMAKILLVWASGGVIALAALNNVADRDTGMEFVGNVLSMKTTFQSPLRRRAITSGHVHQVMFNLIILWEALVSFLCTTGGVQMIRHLESDAEEFHEAKKWAIWGLVTQMLLFLVAFRGVAGQWFAMWQSPKFNGLPDAHRLFQVASAILLVLMQKDN